MTLTFLAYNITSNGWYLREYWSSWPLHLTNRFLYILRTLDSYHLMIRHRHILPSFTTAFQPATFLHCTHMHVPSNSLYHPALFISSSSSSLCSPPHSKPNKIFTNTAAIPFGPAIDCNNTMAAIPFVSYCCHQLIQHIVMRGRRDSKQTCRRWYLLYGLQIIASFYSAVVIVVGCVGLYILDCCCLLFDWRESSLVFMVDALVCGLLAWLIRWLLWE